MQPPDRVWDSSDMTWKDALEIAYRIGGESGIPEAVMDENWLGYVIWNDTGWPVFFRGNEREDFEGQLRSAMEEAKRKIDEARKR